MTTVDLKAVADLLGTAIPVKTHPDKSWRCSSSVTVPKTWSVTQVAGSVLMAAGSLRAKSVALVLWIPHENEDKASLIFQYEE